VNVTALELALTDEEIREAQGEYLAIMEDPPEIDASEWEAYAERAYARVLRRKLAAREAA